jgi:CAAX prenyl protease-like protein
MENPTPEDEVPLIGTPPKESQQEEVPLSRDNTQMPEESVDSESEMPYPAELPEGEEDEAEEEVEKAPPLPAGILRNQPFLTFLLPFIVFALVQSLEPAHPDSLEPGEENKNWLVIHLEYEDYPKVYTAKIVLTVLAMLFVLPGYRTFPFSIHWEALAVGVLGAIAWILLCEWKLEDKLYPMLNMSELVDLTRRPGFNPLEQMKETPLLAYGFLAVRLFGLVVVVAIMEEFFLRGFVMRMFVDFDYWEEVPFGKVNDFALLAGTLVPVLTHPASELLAVVVWFSAVTWLMLRRKNIWDCVAAHAVTNLILGVYVVFSGSWFLM